MEICDFKKIIWNYTKKISDNTNEAFNSIGARYNLTMMQLRILMVLYDEESHTIGSLAEDVCIAGANMSSMCKRLEKQGFIERKRDPSDERVVKINLTEAGIKTVKEVDKYLNKKIYENMAYNSEEAFSSIINGMEKLDSLLQSIIADEENVNEKIRNT